MTGCYTYIGSKIQVSNNTVNPVDNVSGFFNSIEYIDGTSQTINTNSINNFYNNIPITVSNEFDSDNKLKQKIINCNNKEYKYYYRYYENEFINYLPTAEYNPCNELINYEYDDFDNIIVKEVVNSSGDIVEKYNFEYDFLNRLIKETKYVISENGLVLDYEYIYTYDQNSNITQKIKNNEIMTFTYASNDSDELYSNVLISTTKNNDITTYTYDSLLCPTKITKGNEETNITWTNGKLTSYGQLLFEYDELGLRTKKISPNSTTNYYYDNDLLIKSVKNNVVINYLYDTNNQLFGFEYNNKTYLYIRDLLGNINQIVDLNGNVMVKYHYTAFGEVTIENPYPLINYTHQLSDILIENNVLLYKGYCYDVETGWFWLSSRYYSPELCRFISPDDVEYLDSESVNGLNLYCYCKNNPIMYADPSGHFTIAALIISFVASVAFEIIEDAMDGELFTDDSHNGWDYLGAGIFGLFGGLSPVGGTLVKQIGSQVLFSLVGGFADAAISGDLKENGFWNTMGSIVLSTTVSIGVGALSKWGVSKMKASSLRKLGSNNAANKVLGKMGVSGKIGKKSNTVLSNMIRNSNWIGNIIADYGASSIMGGVLSMIWGYHFDGRWF